MIPYFSWTHFMIGPVTVYVWGLFVASGILIGAFVGAWLAKQRGQDPKIFWDLAFWVTTGAMIFARFVHVAFYEPAYFASHPLEILAVWNGGLSIIGGFIGAAIFGLAYLRREKVDVHAYADTAMFGLPVGLFVGRIGCFLIHDHPGTVTDVFLGVNYPDGVIRHDLGLYESLLGLAIAMLFFFLWRRKAPVGTYLWVFCLSYGSARFFLDFLRATSGPIVDVRYVGLTPAQYAAVLMVGIGVWLALQQRRKLTAKS